jgi:hypothetical protein
MPTEQLFSPIHKKVKHNTPPRTPTIKHEGLSRRPSSTVSGPIPIPFCDHFRSCVSPEPTESNTRSSSSSTCSHSSNDEEDEEDKDEYCMAYSNPLTLNNQAPPTEKEPHTLADTTNKVRRSSCMTMYVPVQDNTASLMNNLETMETMNNSYSQDTFEYLLVGHTQRKENVDRADQVPMVVGSSNTTTTRNDPASIRATSAFTAVPPRVGEGKEDERRSTMFGDVFYLDLDEDDRADNNSTDIEEVYNTTRTGYFDGDTGVGGGGDGAQSNAATTPTGGMGKDSAIDTSPLKTRFQTWTPKDRNTSSRESRNGSSGGGGYLMVFNPIVSDAGKGSTFPNASTNCMLYSRDDEWSFKCREGEGEGEDGKDDLATAVCETYQWGSRYAGS